MSMTQTATATHWKWLISPSSSAFLISLTMVSPNFRGALPRLGPAVLCADLTIPVPHSWGPSKASEIHGRCYWRVNARTIAPHLRPVNPPPDIVAIQIMDIGRLDLNLLRVLDAMFQTRKVTEAGIRLNLSQPAMSAALSKLRKTFGDPMFVRTAHGMQPTPLALQMAGAVREILARAEVLHRSTFEPAKTEHTFTLSLSDAERWSSCRGPCDRCGNARRAPVSRR
jgi:hypothetical protein